jgi:hypothetical protein
MEYSTNSPARGKVDDHSSGTQRRLSNNFNERNILATEDNINS